MELRIALEYPARELLPSEVFLQATEKSNSVLMPLRR